MKKINNINKHLVIIIAVLIVVTIGVSYSYFAADIISEGVTKSKLNTGKLKLVIDDEGISANDIAPIYDEDYEMLALKKNFSINSSSSDLNSCASIYLNISDISGGLKSEYFKYKIVSKDIEKEGNFINASSNKKMLLVDKVFIENDKSIDYDLYIWISYKDGVDQSNMLGTTMKAKLLVEGVDIKTKEECDNLKKN